MNQNLITYYIDNMTINDIKKYAIQNNIKITNNEANIIYSFIKKNKNRMKKENKNVLLHEAKPLLCKNTYDLIVQNINKYLK